MAVRKIERGHYFEDFEVGHLFKHHWGRTITDGDNSFFSSVTMPRMYSYFRSSKYPLASFSRPVNDSPICVCRAAITVFFASPNDL